MGRMRGARGRDEEASMASEASEGAKGQARNEEATGRQRQCTVDTFGTADNACMHP